jgi:hypothetical protein
MTASSHQNGNGVAKRAAWRAPSLTEDAIADVTLNQLASPGDDGSDVFGPPYDTTGLS